MVAIDGREEIRISFPARPGYLRIIRVAATAMADDGGFDVDELDDLRLAVDEAVAWLMAGDDIDTEVDLTLSVEDARIDIVGRIEQSGLAVRGFDDLVDAILGATVDTHEFGSTEGHRDFRLSKRRANGA